MENNYVLAMYDVRGIQDYIFRTPRIKDAIGASAIVENIITDALKEAVHQVKLSADEYCLEWFHDGTGPVVPFCLDDKVKVQVLYIGGGNGYVLIDEDLCKEINQSMAKYVMEVSYSLQLSIATVPKKDNYSTDYYKLQKKMQKVKGNMPLSKPIGALPVMKVDAKTGYAIADEKHGDGTENVLKREKTEKLREESERAKYILDNYITEKDNDSILALVHIDGNNMGMRMRNLIQDKKDYTEAVNVMRQVSYQINHSYQSVFDKMEEHFNHDIQIKNKKNSYFLMKVLVAGDDITYLCNAQIALHTVEYYCQHIAGCSMTGGTDADSIRDYGFSVCAGIALFHSHFPFHAAYVVAEECCESAKKRAKEDIYKEELSTGEFRIGNWVDFQICKNIQAKALSAVRRKEYLTSAGESLLLRPYHIKVTQDIQTKQAIPREFEYEFLKRALQYFSNEKNSEKNLPRSFAKELRNAYSMGREQVGLLQNFLHSRNWKMPGELNGGEDEFYVEVSPVNAEMVLPTALWYDALEILDYYGLLEGKK